MKRVKKSFIMLLTFVFLCGIGTLAYVNEKNKITKSIPREISFDTETEVSDASANTVVKETKEPVFEKKEEPAAEASTENVPEKIVFAYRIAFIFKDDGGFQNAQRDRFCIRTNRRCLRMCGRNSERSF